MTTRTKIVCTIGPACSTPQKIEELIIAGMNIARLNFSHGDHAQHGKQIQMLKEARKKLRVPLGIMLDTKGPEIRLGKLKGGQIKIERGEHLYLVKEEIEGTKEGITLTPASAVDSLEKEMFVLLDDGYIVAHVVDIDQKGALIEVDHGGIIHSKKGVNIPGADVDLPALTKQDINDITFGCQQDVDFIAASFVRFAEDVVTIKKILKEQGRPDIKLIAKIENRKGVDNFDTILQAADSIMIARGDLGVELPLNQVPRLQKMMVRKSYLASKSTVTATQMLESMIINPRPTRAEASDVANAIYDSTSAVMLSGETAVGNYPVQSVRVMHSIIEETENDFDYENFFLLNGNKELDIASSVAAASITTAYSAQAKAIFAFSTSGTTPRLLSRLRPRMPIVAMTSDQKVYHQLSLCWGVIPLLDQDAHTIEEAYKKISAFAIERKLVELGDLVVITAGTPFGRAGTTNMMIVEKIGDELDRGTGSIGS
ncbi:MAG: Pyruvate kinase [Chlamydiales bacterium]|nr:Pyruvate kinase [Chlamydiales bacterium]MCH9619142.1 Pyruvate kinase [Chlamydiales bacterium]MCH9622404.1 Pyruvate kinase [Chlamydiales bacterium]